MSEKDDIMALSFLVGGAINDLKKNTTGSDAKNIVGGLEDPKQFIHKMARTNLNDAAMEARMDLQRRVGAQGGQTSEAPQQPPQPPQQPPQPPQQPQTVGNVQVAPLSDSSLSELIEKLDYSNKMLEDIAISLNGILKCFLSKDQKPETESSDE